MNADGGEFNWTGDWIIDGTVVGKYIGIDLRQEPFASGNQEYVGLIIKKPGTWSGQSEDAFIYLNRLYPHKNESGIWQANVYVCPGEGSSLIVSDLADDVL